MFSEYLQRQCHKRKNLFKGIPKSTFYRRLKNPNELTISELRWLINMAELDKETVVNFIFNNK